MTVAPRNEATSAYAASNVPVRDGSANGSSTLTFVMLA